MPPGRDDVQDAAAGGSDLDRGEERTLQQPHLRLGVEGLLVLRPDQEVRRVDPRQRSSQSVIGEVPGVETRAEWEHGRLKALVAPWTALRPGAEAVASARSCSAWIFGRNAISVFGGRSAFGWSLSAALSASCRTPARGGRGSGRSSRGQGSGWRRGTRKATSSRQRRSMPREERSPTA